LSEKSLDMGGNFVGGWVTHSKKQKGQKKPLCQVQKNSGFGKKRCRGD